VTLDNALNQSQDGRTLHIEITGERQGDRVCYSISDNGPGVEPEYRERVFRVFERLSSAGEGTGIGLSILRRVVESTGGRAWIEETPGGGCRVLFDLPAGETP
jgi:signal transduction histidine kinase